MSLFIRLSTQCLTDGKLLDAGTDACWLWVKGLLYAKEHLTDGFIPTAAVALIAVGIKNPKAAVVKLVSTELWFETDGGYTVGLERWSRWQTTADDVEKQREGWRERQRRARERRAAVMRDYRDQSTEHRVQSTESAPLPPTPSHDFADDPEETIPDGLHPTQYATFVLEQAGVPGGHTLTVKFGEAIKILGKEEACTMAQATKRMLDRVREAQRSGPVKWGFWLEERRFMQSLEISTAGWEQ